MHNIKTKRNRTAAPRITSNLHDPRYQNPQHAMDADDGRALRCGMQGSGVRGCCHTSPRVHTHKNRAHPTNIKRPSQRRQRSSNVCKHIAPSPFLLHFQPSPPQPSFPPSPPSTHPPWRPCISPSILLTPPPPHTHPPTTHLLARSTTTFPTPTPTPPPPPPSHQSIAITMISSSSDTPNTSPADGASTIASGPPALGAIPMAVWPRARTASWIWDQVRGAGAGLAAGGRPKQEARLM